MRSTPLKYYNQRQSIFFSYFGVLILFLPILFYAQNKHLSQIGSLFLIVCYLFALIDNLYRVSLFTLNKKTRIFLVMIALYTVSLVLSREIRNFYSYTLCIGGLYVLFYFTEVDFNRKTQLIFQRYSILILLLLVPLGIYLGLNGGISIFTGYSNYFNKVIFKLMLPMSFFLVTVIKRKYLIWVPLIMVYWLMIERTSALIALIILGSYYLWPVLLKKRQHRNRFFWILVISLLLFTVIYVWLFQTEFGYRINLQVRQWTGKNFFSGRQTIWVAAFEAIQKKPLFGYGFDPNVLLEYGVEMSPHNVYIYMLLQTGIIGISLFFFFLYAIWQSLSKCLTDQTKISLSYYLALLVFMNFELTLVANTMVLGLYYTLAIALGTPSENENLEERRNESRITNRNHSIFFSK